MSLLLGQAVVGMFPGGAPHTEVEVSGAGRHCEHVTLIPLRVLWDKHSCRSHRFQTQSRQINTKWFSFVSLVRLNGTVNTAHYKVILEQRLCTDRVVRESQD